ncbi:MAG: protein phosphatase 2C domain-containing protein [Anaerobutyricum soehngenii]
MKSFGMTDIGRKRKVNQDYLFFSDEPIGCFPNLYIVADGMGGHKAGDKASSYAVNRFVELAKKEKKELPFLVMERLLNEVNEAVYELSCKEEQYAGMGTTFVAATVVDKTAHIMNVGDSLTYYFDGKIRQATMHHLSRGRTGSSWRELTGQKAGIIHRKILLQRQWVWQKIFSRISSLLTWKKEVRFYYVLTD